MVPWKSFTFAMSRIQRKKKKVFDLEVFKSTLIGLTNRFVRSVSVRQFKAISHLIGK